MEPHLPILQVIVPLLTAPLVLLLRDRTLAWAAATAASLCAFGIALFLALTVRDGTVLEYALGSWPVPYGIALTVDAFSALLLLIISGGSSAALLIARQSLAREVEPGRQHLLYTAWLLALAGLLGIAVAGDAFNIFVFMEISSLATYILIAGGPDRRAFSAVFRYLIMGTMGATFYLIGVGLVYMMTGTLNLADMQLRLAEAGGLTPVLAAAGFVTVGLALKAAIFPLHGWLPNAYAHAPHAVTVFIAACSTKVALYVLFRFDFLVFQGSLPGHGELFAAFVVTLAIIAVLAASVLAIRAHELKKLLAYSSVAQIGYMVLGAGLLSVAGLSAGIVHMFNHALAKGALFMAVACLATGSGLSLNELAGAARRMPLTVAAFLLAGLSLIGIPGTAGFVGKWQLVLAALSLGPAGIALAAPVLIGSLLAVAYIWRVVEAAYFGVVEAAPRRAEAPGWMLTMLWLAVAANIYFGVQPEFPLDLARQAALALWAG